VTVESYELTDPRAPTLDLSVGAMVVYGSLGIGRVSSRERDEAGSITVTVEFASGLSVSVPLDRATTCFRPPAGAVELDDVRDVLRTRDVPIEQSWRARSQSMRSKISAGETVGLAEVVRDSVQRTQLTPGATLSPAEQDLYRKARHLLAAELGAVADLEESEAETWIDHQLGWAAE
jgi:RNA polymerase-interacting CarD/CdnL/TRCF family regulator